MAWNDPPSSNYQQISNSTRKFKHRYVPVSNLSQQITQAQYQNQPIQQNYMAPNLTNQAQIVNAQDQYQPNYNQQNIDYQQHHQSSDQFNSSSNNSQQSQIFNIIKN